MRDMVSIFVNLSNVWLNRRQLYSHICSVSNLLQCVLLVEVYEENPDSHRYLTGKGKTCCTSVGSSDKTENCSSRCLSKHLRNLIILFLFGRNLINISILMHQQLSNFSVYQPMIFMFHEGTFFIYTKSNLVEFQTSVSNMAQIRYSLLSFSYLNLSS